MGRTRGNVANTSTITVAIRDIVKPFYKSKQLRFEEDVDIVSLSTDTLAKRGIDYLSKANLTPLLSPPKFAYPRLVRLFYQNLQRVKPNIYNDDQDYMQVNFGGVNYVIDRMTITKALGFDLCRRPDSPISKSKAYTDDDVVRELGGDPIVRRVTLPQRMWIIDHIFHRNLFPLGHKQKRKEPLLGALYAVHVGMWFSPSSRIFDGIWNAHYNFTELTKAGKSNPLPYPRTISAILKHLGLPISEKEEVVTNFPSFGMKTFRYSVKRLKKGEDDDQSPPTKKLRGCPGQEQALSDDQYKSICPRLERLGGDVINLRGDFFILKAAIQDLRGDYCVIQSMMRSLITANPKLIHAEDDAATIE